MRAAEPRLKRAIMTRSNARAGRGEALRFTLSAEEMEDADRRVEKTLGSLAEVPAEDVTDDELTEALQRLHEEERAVSNTRLAIFRVHDTLHDELKRRFREDP